MAVFIRSVICTVLNETEQDLALDLGATNLEHGSFDTSPPRVIPSGGTATWKSSTAGFMTGTEGTVTYDIGSTGGSFSVSWDNPFIGENSIGQRCSGFAEYVHKAPVGLDLETSEPIDEERVRSDDDLSVRHVFTTRADDVAANGTAPLGHPPSNQDPKPTSTSAGVPVLVRDADATFRKMVFLGLNNPQSDLEVKEIQKHLPVMSSQGRMDYLTTITPSNYTAERAVHAQLATPSAKAWAATFTTLPQAQRTKLADVLEPEYQHRYPPYALVLFARALARVEAELTQLAKNPSHDNGIDEQPPFKRLIISAHHAGYRFPWAGSFYGDGGSEGLAIVSVKTLKSLTGVFPAAMAQVEDICLSACNTGHNRDSAPPRDSWAILRDFPSIFPNLQSVWAYENTAPSGAAAAIENAEWEKVTRRSQNKAEVLELGRHRRNEMKSIGTGGKPGKGGAWIVVWERHGDTLEPCAMRG